MGLLSNLWFPNGSALTDLIRIETNGETYGPFPSASVFADPDVASRCSLVDYQGETVAKITCFADDPVGVLSSKRTELYAERNEERAPLVGWSGESGSRRWYRFKVMLAHDFVFETGWADTDQRLILWQVHDDPDTSPADYVTTPPLWMRLYPDGRFWFETTDCADTETTGPPDPVNYTRTKRWSTLLVPGVPAEFVVYAKWAWDASGALTIWRDCRKIYEQTGIANAFNDDAARGGGPLFAKFGTYCKLDAVDRTAYHWGLQTADEEVTTFDEFMEACGASQRELEGFVTRGVSL